MTAAPQSGLRVITVLIVDSHPMVAEGVAATLNHYADIRVVGIEESCAGAVAVAGPLCPDVVLLEQRMADGLGTDLLPVLLANPQTKALMVTAEDNDAVLARAVAAGASGIISKNKPIAALIAAIRAVVEDEPVITPAELRRLLPKLAGLPSGPGADLTARERDVLRMLVAGKSTSALAAELFIAPATARNHIQSIMNKLGAHSRLEAVSITVRHNILDSAA